MKSFKRADRVGRLIKKVLSEVIVRQIKDPRLAMTTITSVKMSPDLKFARVYFSVAGDEKKKEEAIEGYRHAIGYVKRILARELGLRYMPELRFFYDDSFDYSSHIDELLKSIQTENGSNHSTPEK